MPSLGPELIVEAVPTVLYAAVGTLLAVAGAFAEYSSLQHLGSGETVLALWFAAFGAIMLYAGIYGLAYQKALKTIA